MKANFTGGLQYEAVRLGAPWKIVEDACPVAFLVVRGARIDVVHAVTHGILEQNRNFARCRGDRFGLAESLASSYQQMSAFGDITQPAFFVDILLHRKPENSMVSKFQGRTQTTSTDFRSLRCLSTSPDFDRIARSV